MNRDFVDFFAVADHHIAIHERLENWARWVRVKPTGWQVSPMFAQYRSKAFQWHAPELKPATNMPEALEMEQAVSLLPEKHRAAIRWCHVFGGSPILMARQLGVTKQGLHDLIQCARAMLIQRGM